MSEINRPNVFFEMLLHKCSHSKLFFRLGCVDGSVNSSSSQFKLKRSLAINQVKSFLLISIELTLERSIALIIDRKLLRRELKLVMCPILQDICEGGTYSGATFDNNYHLDNVTCASMQGKHIYESVEILFGLVLFGWVAQNMS